jgi:hypothetical protein
VLREAVQQHNGGAVARLGDVQAGAAYLYETVRHPGHVRERPGAGAGWRISRLETMPPARD